MEFFYILKRERENDKIIISNKKKDIQLIDIKLINKFINDGDKIQESEDKDIIYMRENIHKINVNNKFYLWSLLNFDINNCYYIASETLNSRDIVKSEFNIYKINPQNNNLIIYIGKVKEIKDKYQNIIFNMVSSGIWSEISKLDICSREILLYKYKLKIISYLFDFLKINGDFFFICDGYCSIEIINLYYLLSFMFNEIIIYNGKYLVCKKFNPIIKKSDIIIDNNFNIEPKYKLNELNKYQEKILLYNIKKNRLLIEKKESEYVSLLVNEIITSFESYNKDLIKKIIVDFNLSLMDLFKSVYINNKVIKTTSAINGKEGYFLVNTIKKYNLRNILEIGFAYGISAFYILSNPQTTLTSIDPNQKTEWDNQGIKLLKEYKFDKRHIFYELKSYMALPKLLEKHGNNYYDFIFIDGFHTFDYTLIDFYYSNLLLRINGIMIIDDAMHSGVKKCVKYIETNYSNFYKKIESPLSFAMFQKINEDKRKWDYYKIF